MTTTNTATIRSNIDKILNANGCVFAGANHVRGGIIRVNISTLRKMEREGALTSATAPDGCLVYRRAR